MAVIKISFIFTIILCTNSCASVPPTLTTTPEASAVKLNEKFQTLARVGSVPIQLDTRDPIIRFSLKPKNRPPIFLVMISPKYATGEINIPIATSKATDPNTSQLNYSESSQEYNRYLDLMLRSHRLILRGDLENAKFSLNQAREEYDETYASLVLRGTIALAEKNSKQAAHFFTQAERLFPEKEIAKLVGGK